MPKKKKKIKARIYKPSENILCFELLKSRKLQSNYFVREASARKSFLSTFAKTQLQVT